MLLVGQDSNLVDDKTDYRSKMTRLESCPTAEAQRNMPSTRKPSDQSRSRMPMTRPVMPQWPWRRE